jgi:hypothetical protein
MGSLRRERASKKPMKCGRAEVSESAFAVRTPPVFGASIYETVDTAEFRCRLREFLPQTSAQRRRSLRSQSNVCEGLLFRVKDVKYVCTVILCTHYYPSLV